MNDNHRKLIKNNVESLIYLVDYDTMIKECLNRKVLTQIMVDIIEQDGKDEMEKKRLLLNKLIHRGPDAFRALLDICKRNNYDEALLLLSGSTNPAATPLLNGAVVVDDTNALSISTTIRLNRSISQTSPSNGNRSDETDDAIALTDGSLFSKPKVKPQAPKPLKLAPYTKKTSFQFDVNLEVKRAANYGQHHKLQVYNMKNKRRGVFLFVNIIKFKNHKDRDGADMDRENLVTLFSEMNYTIFYYEDLTRQDCYQLIENLIRSDYLKQIDSFICCFQTHGDLYQNQTVMEFSDGLTISTEYIIDKFSNVSCQTLINKPKVFFFPFCRGKISDTEKKLFAVIETDGSTLVPSFSDILICYGTVPGFTTHRDTGFGSWYVIRTESCQFLRIISKCSFRYIREMCKIFAEHACDLHIEDLLKLVSTKTMEIRDSGRLQVASTETRGFNKLLFFNPKISD